MRYLIDKTEVSEELERSFVATRTYVREYNVCFVCNNCGSELYWDFKYPDTKDELDQWKYNRLKEELVEYRKLIDKGLDYANELRRAENLYNRLTVEWEEKNRRDKQHRIVKEKFLAAHESKVCPICGAKLLREKGYYIPNKHSDKQVLQGDKWYAEYKPSWEYGDTDDQFALLARVRESMEQEQIDSAVATYLQICDSYVAPVTSGKSTEIQQNCESLKTYLLNLIHLENNIYSLKQQLSELYRRRMANDLLIVHDAHAPSYVIKQGLKGVKDEYHRALKAVDDAKAYRPRIVVSYPTKPNEPTLGKPGIFNKKKVMAENEALTKAYQAAMEEYNKKVQICDGEKARKIAEAQNAAISKAQQKADAVKQKLDDAQNKASQKIQKMQSHPAPSKAIKSILDNEIAEIEDLLKKTFAARNELYAYDIVFGKYRDVVALSSFYEYLMSGRCTSLTGADGAYNIYESEIRMNRVIAQLDTVISSLEEIKQNQYMMYQEMRSISASLQSLNTTMDKALTSIQGIEANTTSMNGYLEHISKNSDVIAHNTAVTAYYSKVNAELTNALGFMVALK